MTTPSLLNGRLFGEEQRCFGCAPHHPFGFHLEFRIEGEEVVTDFTPTSDHQGPPSVMHGGLVTTLADETAAWAIIALRGKFGFTTKMECRFVRPVRVGSPVEARASIVRDAGRIVHVRARLSQEATLAFSSDMTFALLDRAGAERVLGDALPDAWLPFVR